jgi:hypothetical protein
MLMRTCIFTHIVLASQYVGVLLFSKYYRETLESMESMLGSGGALAGHLFECYVHYLFVHGDTKDLACRLLDGSCDFLSCCGIETNNLLGKANLRLCMSA